MEKQLKEFRRIMPNLTGISAATWSVESFCSTYISDVPLYFSNEELSECSHFKSVSRHHEWLAVRMALKKLLIIDGVVRSPLNISIRKNEKGAPFVVIYDSETGFYDNLNCSLSHKGNIVFAAYSHSHDIKIGIDIEKKNWKLAYLKRKFLSPEDSCLIKYDSQVAYAILWSFKESVSKIIELGFSYGFKNIICKETSPGIFTISDLQNRTYGGHYIIIGSHVLTLSYYIDADVEHKKSDKRKVGFFKKISRAYRLRKLKAIREKSLYLRSSIKEEI